MAKKKKSKQKDPEGTKVVAVNKKARHRYEILDRYEAGIELLGPEVKSLRDGTVTISESFCKVVGGQVFVHNLNVNRYAQSGYVQHDPLRIRRLLLHKTEIRRITASLDRKGLTLIPLRLYFNKDGRAKLEIATARGKGAPDKREAIKRADVNRDLAREVKGRRS